MNDNAPEHYTSAKGKEEKSVEEPKKPYSPTYSPASSRPSSYLQCFQQERRDLSRFLPATTMHTFPKQGNEGLYGWTHRQKDGMINVRENLHGEKRIETIIHESIHTPDEYETKRLTEWIMESMFPKEERYRTKPEEYVR